MARSAGGLWAPLLPALTLVAGRDAAGPDVRGNVAVGESPVGVSPGFGCNKGKK